MSASVVLRHRRPRIARALSGSRARWKDLGDQARFYAQSIGSIGQAVSIYRAELLRQIAAIGLGAGSLAVVGGTVAVVAFLNLSTSGAWQVRPTTRCLRSVWKRWRVFLPLPSSTFGWSLRPARLSRSLRRLVPVPPRSWAR